MAVWIICFYTTAGLSAEAVRIVQTHCSITVSQQEVQMHGGIKGNSKEEQAALQ